MEVLFLNLNEEFVNFDQFADDYDFTRAISEDFLKIFLTNFLEINDKDGSLQNVLEIGCGTGRISKIFAINNFNVTGVDVSQKMLTIALIKAQEEKWNFNGVIADARNLPFKDNEFDIALTVHVLHLIKDWKKVIQEALRCSKTKRFVKVFLDRSIFKTEIMINYWKFINDSGFSTKYNTEKMLGAQNSEEVIEYMKLEGFSFIKKEFNNRATIKREILIDIVKRKSFSSQRFIPDEIHQLTMDYLAKHDYFLPKDQEEVEILERGMLLNFFKQ